MKKRTVLIDGDPIVYRTGFAGQTSTVRGIFEDEHGVPYFKDFANKTEVDTYLGVCDECKLLDTERMAKAEPLANVLNILKTTVEMIQRETGAGDTVVFLSGSENYRNLIAKQKPYKGNRDRSTRPVHYDAIREFLIERYGAGVSVHNEADDEVSIAARRIPGSIVASIDKDMEQIPGLHYDYMKHVGYEVNEEDARMAFWRQVLSGDAGDNVPGLAGVGPKKAADMLYKAGVSDNDLWEVCRFAYELAGMPDAALETAQLVYLQQKDDELWNPPGCAMGSVNRMLNENRTP